MCKHTAESALACMVAEVYYALEVVLVCKVEPVFMAEVIYLYGTGVDFRKIKVFSAAVVIPNGNLRRARIKKCLHRRIDFSYCVFLCNLVVGRAVQGLVCLADDTSDALKVDCY